MRVVTNHELLAMSELQSWRQHELQLWREQIDGGKQKRRRAEVASPVPVPLYDEVQSQRQDIARGPVSMSEIRRIQDALYRQSR